MRSFQQILCKGRENLHLRNRDMIDMEREKSSGTGGKTQEKAAYSGMCQTAAVRELRKKEELGASRGKKLQCRQQGEDLEPERKALGFH